MNNSKNVGRLVTRAFPRVPPRAEIPETVSPFGGLIVDWRIGDVRIRTRKHTMGRVFATATSAKFPDEYVSVYASNHLAAVRRLVKYCRMFYPLEEE